MELRDDDVLTVLRTLEYDRAVDCGPGLGEDDEDVFRETKLPVPEHHAATSLPCGVCPVRTLSPQELFSFPSSCVYLSPQRDLETMSRPCSLRIGEG